MNSSTMMRVNGFPWVALLSLCLIVGTPSAQPIASFDFFYFVVQWPASYCDLKNACCYPKTGKPASNFSIHGLWPNFDDGTYPTNCDSSNRFDSSQVQDLVPVMNKIWGSLSCPSSDSSDFWAHEWNKHGTCSGLGQHAYFKDSITLFQNINFLPPLQSAGILPNGQQYNINTVQKTLAQALNGHLPGVECNTDANGRRQLYQVYICVDTDGKTLIDCPLFPNGKCLTSVYWPRF